MMSHNRPYVWADVIRSLAIFLVVYIHTRTTFETPPPFSYIFDTLDFSAAICISLFILLSGALLLPKQENVTTFFRKRLIKIFIPWLFWILIWIIFDHNLFLNHAQNFLLTLRIFARYFLSRFWFLPIIFCLYLFTPLLRIYLVKLKTNVLTLILILWLFFFIIFPIFLLYHGIYNPSNTLLTIFQFLGIYILGYVIVERYKPSRNFFLGVMLLLFGLIITFIELLFMNKLTVARLEAFPYNFISPEIIFVSIGVFISIFIIFNGKYNKHLNNSIQNILSYISKAALGIYLTHEFFINLYNWLSIPNFLPFEKTIIVFTLSSFFIITLSKIRYIKILVS